ncbi:MAG: hypothetical protein MUF71_12975 [Candidatus Kapabacteria bacterium]|jgi:hypothetical protein|nr:hypothetical protein [Candidatus Kapabacteria bacterium]
MTNVLQHPAKRFFTALISVPAWFFAIALPLSLAWCLVLGIIDNEADQSKPFFERYANPLMWLWYGLPTFVSMLWLMSVAMKQKHSVMLGALWSIPLGCLLGTVIALPAFAVVFGFMRLTGLA